MELKKNKKGFVGIIYFIIFALIIVTVSVMFVYIGNTTKEQLHESLDSKTENGSAVNYSRTIDDTFGGVTTAYGSLYWIALFLIVGMVFGIFIASYFVTFHPVVFIFYLFFLIAIIIASVGVSNGYELMRADETLASTFNTFAGVNFIMGQLPLVVTIVGFIGGIIMFVRFKQASGIGGYGYYG